MRANAHLLLEARADPIWRPTGWRLFARLYGALGRDGPPVTLEEMGCAIAEGVREAWSRSGEYGGQ